MQEFHTFHFTSHTRDPETLQASFSFSFDDIVHFTEYIDFACEGFTPLSNADPNVMKNLLFHLSLALGISYYKLFPTRTLIVENGFLDETQKAFRNQFYVHGLGEYFFTNQISPRNLCQFVNNGVQAEFPFTKSRFTSQSKQIMIPIGGGKDSLVSVELVKKLGMPFITSTFGKDYLVHQMVSEKIDAPRLIMRRTMDPKLFDMNEAGYYNGHIPISGIIAFVLVTAAYLYDYTDIVMSNEKSANEGNTEMDGIDINHQRSKSLAFETAFAEYIHHAITKDVQYFSLLRGMYEIKIAQLFAQYPQYFDVFSSCNTNFKLLEKHQPLPEKRRCGNCPKCAFVYTILRPFLTHEQAIAIRGAELFEKKDLLTTFKELLGIEGIKPFECVGTNEEMVLAIKKSYDLRTQKYKISLPIILDMFAQEILPHMSKNEFTLLEKKLMRIYDEDMIPQIFRTLLPH